MLHDYTDVKIFVDSLLMSYQIDRRIQLKIERHPMRCTSYRQDPMFGKNLLKIKSVT